MNSEIMKTIKELLHLVNVRRNQIGDEDFYLRNLQTAYEGLTNGENSQDINKRLKKNGLKTRPEKVRAYNKVRKPRRGMVTEVNADEVPQNKIDVPPVKLSNAQYSSEWIFQEKMTHLDSLNPRGFRVKSRREQVKTLEPVTYEETMKYDSQLLDVMYKRGIYIKLKYNNNNGYCFYFKPEWLTKVGENSYEIKEECKPLESDYDDIPAAALSNMHWMVYSAENKR